MDYEKIGENVCRVAMAYMPFSDCRARLLTVMHKITAVLYERYINYCGIIRTEDKKTISHIYDEPENKRKESETIVNFESDTEKSDQSENSQKSEKASDLLKIELNPIKTEIINEVIKPQNKTDLLMRQKTNDPKIYINQIPLKNEEINDNQEILMKPPPIEKEEKIGEELLPAADLDEIFKELIEEEEVKEKEDENCEKSDDDISSTESESEIQSRILANRKKKKNIDIIKTSHKKPTNDTKKKLFSQPIVSQKQNNSQKPPKMPKIPYSTQNKSMIGNTKLPKMDKITGSSFLMDGSFIPASSSNPTDMTPIRKTVHKSNNTESYPLRISRLTTNSNKSNISKQTPFVRRNNYEDQPTKYSNNLNRSVCGVNRGAKPNIQPHTDFVELNLRGLKLLNSKDEQKNLNKTQNAKYYCKRQLTTEINNPDELIPIKSNETQISILHKQDLLPFTNNNTFLEEYANKSKNELVRRCSQQTKLRVYSKHANFSIEREREYINNSAEQSLSKLRKPQKSTRLLRRQPEIPENKKVVFFLEGKGRIPVTDVIYNFKK